MQAGCKGAARLLSSTIGAPPITTLLPPPTIPKLEKQKNLSEKFFFQRKNHYFCYLEDVV